jgi:hypothetical protein
MKEKKTVVEHAVSFLGGLGAAVAIGKAIGPISDPQTRRYMSGVTTRVSMGFGDILAKDVNNLIKKKK